MIGEPSTDASLAVFALIALLALAALAATRWVRGRVARGDEGAIRLVAVRSLGGKRMLAVVEVEKERFLLGMTDERIACLGRVPRPDAPQRTVLAEVG
jgi:flagellar biogenesis protein FliO